MSRRRARKIGAAFHDAPLLAIDFLRDAKTGKLWFLECNPGGNTWHFSSDQAGGVNLRMELGEAWLQRRGQGQRVGAPTDDRPVRGLGYLRAGAGEGGARACLLSLTDLP